jgi:hypothetical protein
MTWFRHEAGIIWFGGFGDDPRVQRQVIDLLHDIGIAAARRGPELWNPALNIQISDQDKG